MTGPFDEAVKARQTLNERFGEVDAFVPAPDGTVSADRMQAFLAVREATQPQRLEIADVFASLYFTEEDAHALKDEGFWAAMKTTWDVTKSGFAVGPITARFFEARNDALVEAGMGLGEYTWLYALCYWAAPGHAPDEGPADAPEIREAAEEDPPMGFETLDALTLNRVRENLRAMLRSQLDALESVESPEVEGAWRETLADELEALDSDRRRVPFQDGLPPRLAAWIEPYRERLEAVYHPAANPFELAINRKKGALSYATE